MVIEPPQPYNIPSQFTSLAELFITLIVLFITVLAVHSAFDKARRYYLDHIHSVDWRRSMNIRFDLAVIEQVRSRTFLNSVVPRHADMGVILAGEVLSYCFVSYSFIGILTLIYSIVRFVIVPTMTVQVTTGDPRNGDFGAGPGLDAAGTERGVNVVKNGE